MSALLFFFCLHFGEGACWWVLVSIALAGGPIERSASYVSAGEDRRVSSCERLAGVPAGGGVMTGACACVLCGNEEKAVPWWWGWWWLFGGAGSRMRLSFEPTMYHESGRVGSASLSTASCAVDCSFASA